MDDLAGDDDEMEFDEDDEFAEADEYADQLDDYGDFGGDEFDDDNDEPEGFNEEDVEFSDDGRYIIMNVLHSVLNGICGFNIPIKFEVKSSYVLWLVCCKIAKQHMSICKPALYNSSQGGFIQNVGLNTKLMYIILEIV